jgi:hypothetical protein
MKIIINPDKLTKLLVEKPHLATDIAIHLEQVLHLPEHQTLCDQLLNSGVAIKTQSMIFSNNPVSNE